jgi:hypothetical protein
MMNSRFKIAAFIGLLAPMACDSGPTNLRSGNAVSQTQNSSNVEAIALTDLTSIKVKNCDQLLRTMSKVTGVDFNDPSIKASFDEIKGACPGSESLDDLSPSNISIGIKLAMDFCGAYADKLAKEKRPSSLNFGQSPETAFSSNAKKDLYKLFYSELWNGDVRGEIPTLSEVTQSSDALLKELLEDNDVKGKEGGTKYVVQGLCVPMLSAAPITTL